MWSADQTVHAVTVAIEPGKSCKVQLFKNGKVDVKGRLTGGKLVGESDPPSDVLDEGGLTLTAFDVTALIVVCSGNDPKDPCSFRITQITEHP